MSLPFWDDFSSSIISDTVWESKATVWINNGMAIDPPTIGVATFDGLNENGIPYRANPTQILDVGFTDSLVSRKIKMTDITLFQRNTVFLSFFYQWGGNGEVPDANDFLRLEFLTNTGLWESIVTLRAEPGQEPDEFYSFSIRINQDKFYHDEFQFRFRSFGRQSGRFDTWNIDYVYLNKGRTENDLAQGFPDRAPHQLLGPLFVNYYAVPKKHFFTDTNNNLGAPEFGITNLNKIDQPSNYNLDATIISYTDEIETVDFIEAASFFPVLPSMLAFEKRVIAIGVNPDLSSFALTDSLFINVRTTYITGDSVNTGFEPINFYANDTIYQDYTLTNYYAYDDGQAEYAIGLTQPGNIVAYRFILQTSAADTLNGIEIHYPITPGVSASNAIFYIWKDDNGKPGQTIFEELIPVQPRPNSEFIQRTFSQSTIVKDTFYIGWRQPLDRVSVGLDTSNDTGDKIYVNTNGSWEQNTLIKGSMMIRPRFGKGTIVTSIEQPQAQAVSIYPNPSDGEFFIKGDIDRIEIINLNGQPVDFTIEQQSSGKQVFMAQPTPGLYIVKYVEDGRLGIQKIIIQK